MTTNTKAAQLYWDDQDPNNTGWWLRYYDQHGNEQGAAIDAVEDAGMQELADAMESEGHLCEGEVAVFRGDRRQGTITIEHGAVNWRAL